MSSKPKKIRLTASESRLPVLALEWDDLDQDDLEVLAAEVVASLRPGDVLVLSGEVGSGKTTFVRAAARSLSVEEAVTSPTYQLARGYEGSLGGRGIRVNHLDLYRLEGVVDARDALELDEYMDDGSVTFIEWAEPALDVLAEPPSVVEISYRSPVTRRVRLLGPVAARLAPAC